MYIAVCDDQAEDLQLIARLLEQWQSDRNTTLRYCKFSSAAELLDTAEHESFTLYLLDIMMPGTNGLSAAKEIRQFNQAAEIVFLTSSPGFAYESYGVRALDYLLKPVRKERLFSTLDQLHAKEHKPEDGLTLKCGSALVRVLFSQLVYVEVQGKHLYFNMVDGAVHEVVGTLKEYGPQLLFRPEFMQPHRSYIVNMLQVSELSPSGIQLFSGKNLPVSRLQYPQLQKDYMKLLFAQREE